MQNSHHRSVVDTRLFLHQFSTDTEAMDAHTRLYDKIYTYLRARCLVIVILVLSYLLFCTINTQK